MPSFLVTVSGADDACPHEALLCEWGGHPGVELGLQFSRSRAGTPRYPHFQWLAEARLFLVGSTSQAIRAALHVNGSACSDMASGNVPSDVAILLAPLDGKAAFSRVQVNLGAGDAEPSNAGGVARLATGLQAQGIRLVLQSKPSTLHLLDTLDSMGVDYDVLHDASEGRGERSLFPPPRTRRFNAWAGGLDPESLPTDIPSIYAAVRLNPGYGWGIDAETGMRENGAFSISRAAEFARIAHAWTGAISFS